MKITRNKLFNKDFILVLIGQIISLFGNAILRFALPLYILKETGSSTLFGLVTAVSFVPMIVLSLIGGVLADRLNKKNIMVILDFMTSSLILVFYLALGKLPIVPLMIVVLMLLYGISGAYQPAVQASMPFLVPKEKLLSGNALISQVGTLSNLLGPVIGGIMYGLWGIIPILILSIICFAASAIMEIFIKLPFIKQKVKSSALAIVKSDLIESYLYVKNKRPMFFSVVIIVAVFNLLLTALMTVGIPVLIIKILNLPDAKLGFTQGVLALGGLFGGAIASIFARKLKIKNAYILLKICAVCVGLMAVPLGFKMDSTISYIIISSLCFFAMAAASIFSIQMLTVVQHQTPDHLIGKVMAALMAISISALPIGQAIYGLLFDLFLNQIWLVLAGATAISLLVSGYAKTVFMSVKKEDLV